MFLWYAMYNSDHISYLIDGKFNCWKKLSPLTIFYLFKKYHLGRYNFLTNQLVEECFSFLSIQSCLNLLHDILNTITVFKNSIDM